MIRMIVHMYPTLWKVMHLSSVQPVLTRGTLQIESEKTCSTQKDLHYSL